MQITPTEYKEGTEAFKQQAEIIQFFEHLDEILMRLIPGWFPRASFFGSEVRLGAAHALGFTPGTCEDAAQERRMREALKWSAFYTMLSSVRNHLWGSPGRCLRTLWNLLLRRELAISYGGFKFSFDGKTEALSFHFGISWGSKGLFESLQRSPEGA